MGSFAVGRELMWQAENCSENLDEERSFLLALVLLTSFAKCPQDTSLAVFASSVVISKEKGEKNKFLSCYKCKLGAVGKFTERRKSFSYPFKNPSIFS